MLSPKIRHTRHDPCPICGGFDMVRRGTHQRCYGFTSGRYSWCTRVEFSGALTYHEGTQAYRHRREGICACGLEHSPAPPMDLSPSGWKKRRKEAEPTGEVDTYFVYFDEHRRPVHRTVKYRNPKDFRQERYTFGMWRRGLRDTRKLLFHLPELLAANPAHPVLMPEGEKDVERLRALGLVATTNPCGARSWEPHMSEWLRGRQVVILEDNDADGEWRGARLEHELKDVAFTVRRLGFPQMEPGADISDWLDAGGTRDRLMQQIQFPASA